MRERVRQLGGRFEIESSGRGTTVRAIVPLEAGTDEDHTNPDSR
jgi:signal transduction histidine kinase